VKHVQCSSKHMSHELQTNQVFYSGITFKDGRGIVEDTETARLKTHRSDENNEICRIAFAQTGPNIIDTGSEAIA